MNFSIFPCGHDKKPLVSGWQTAATKDTVEINKWCDLFRERIGSFGVPTGQENGLLVLDVDVKDFNGFETLRTLPIPNTRFQRTPSGGAHYFFKYPNDGKRYSGRVRFKPGLDARGEGNYICYYGADETPIADAPAWFLEECLKKPDPVGEPIAVSPSITLEIVESVLQNIYEAGVGERNNTLNKEAFRIGQLVSAGAITREYAEQILTQSAMETGLEPNETRLTIASAIGGGHTKPMLVPFGPPSPEMLAMSLPAPPEPERWTPPYFTPFELNDTSKLRRPQLFKDWSTADIQLMNSKGGVGKSTLKLYEAVCLALGAPFLGFECLSPGKTLFITGEDTREKLGAMLGAITRQMRLTPEEMNTVLSSVLVKKDSDLCVVTRDKTGFYRPNTIALEKVVEACREIKPKMIVFDPIASFWGSESALNDMALAVNKFMGRLAEIGDVCVEMINHIGKQSGSDKDMDQYAGRGGSGLPSHARVVKALMSVDEDEFTEMTNGKQLGPNQSAILCNVGKFSDGSPLLGKKFLIIREGYMFTRMDLEAVKVREEKQKNNDGERIIAFIKEMRALGKYPTKPFIIAHFMSLSDSMKIGEARVKRALETLRFMGQGDRKIQMIENPDASVADKAFVVTDHSGTEV